MAIGESSIPVENVAMLAMREAVAYEQLPASGEQPGKSGARRTHETYALTLQTLSRKLSTE